MKITLRTKGFEVVPESKMEESYLRTILERLIFVYPDSKIITWKDGIKITGKGN